MNTAVRTAPNRLTKAEVARRLNVSLKTVDRMIEEGHLRTVTLPGMKRKVLETSLDEVIARIERGDEPQAN